jgi:flagellar hook-length control protein FliK
VPAGSDRAREDASQSRKSDADDAAVDTSTKESGAEADASTPAAEAAAAVAAAGQAGSKSHSKRAVKRGAGDVDEAGVEAIGGKSANAADDVRGKPGKKSRVTAKDHDAELNAAKELVEVKAAVTEGADEEKTPDDKALTADQKLAAEAATDLTDRAGAHASEAHVAVEAVSKGVAEETAIKAKANAEAVVAANPAEATAATGAAPKRARAKNDEPALVRDGAQPSPGKEGAAANAPGAAAVEALSNIAGDEGESAEQKERSAEEVKPADRNDKNESRIGAAPALLASRSDRGHEANGRGDGLTEAERARFVQRVASAFRSFGDEGGEVRLRLSPPELGSLRVELTVRDGVLSARLEAETSAARNLLLDNLPALRERLAEQNIKVEKFDVDVRDERRQTAGEQFTGQPDQGRQGDRQRGRTFDHRPVTAAAVARATSTPIKHGDASELNIVI